MYTQKGINDHTQFSTPQENKPRQLVWKPTGRKQTRETVKNFSDGLVASLNPASWDAVVAVHNNTRGGYGFKYYSRGSGVHLAEETFEGEPGNSDNFFYVTRRSDFDALKELKKYNVVLQNNQAVFPGSRGDDGSLSVWAVHHGEQDGRGNVTPVRYINVEVQDADKQKDIERYARNLNIQMKMLLAVHNLVSRR